MEGAEEGEEKVGAEDMLEEEIEIEEAGVKMFFTPLKSSRRIGVEMFIYRCRISRLRLLLTSRQSQAPRE